jgi:hypothetical protein
VKGMLDFRREGVWEMCGVFWDTSRNIHVLGQSRRCIPVTAVPRLRWKDYEFKASLG